MQIWCNCALVKQRAVFEASARCNLLLNYSSENSSTLYRGRSQELQPETVVRLASLQHLITKKNKAKSQTQNRLQKCSNLSRVIEATNTDLPCSSSLEEGELPSSQELLLLPFEVKLFVVLFTEFLPLLFPEISVVPFSNIAGISMHGAELSLRLRLSLPPSHSHD